MRVGPTLDKLLADYPNDVRVVYKMHPLPMHQNAMIAAEAAMAAHAQGKFQPMHEKLMANSTSLTREHILQLAAEVGLDVERFTHDLDAHAHKPGIDAETQEVMKLGVSGTPASFVNGRLVSGAQPYEAFKRLVDEQLGKTAQGAAPAP
ncbi:MAG TPA: DsbA family protein [Candidatus Polarisedimenticolaceae bacterium]|nr:DsbA family protein [Candidatus Polarisedimenticolaceae bacterium]